MTHVIGVQQSASASASVTSTSSPLPPNQRSFKHRTFVHMFDQCTQNARAVTSILADVFKRLKAQGTYVIFDVSLVSSVDLLYEDNEMFYL